MKLPNKQKYFVFGVFVFVFSLVFVFHTEAFSLPSKEKINETIQNLRTLKAPEFISESSFKLLNNNSEIIPKTTAAVIPTIGELIQGAMKVGKNAIGVAKDFFADATSSPQAAVKKVEQVKAPVQEIGFSLPKISISDEELKIPEIQKISGIKAPQFITEKEKVSYEPIAPVRVVRISVVGDIASDVWSRVTSLLSPDEKLVVVDETTNLKTNLGFSLPKVSISDKNLKIPEVSKINVPQFITEKESAPYQLVEPIRTIRISVIGDVASDVWNKILAIFKKEKVTIVEPEKPTKEKIAEAPAAAPEKEVVIREIIRERIIERPVQEVRISVPSLPAGFLTPYPQAPQEVIRETIVRETTTAIDNTALNAMNTSIQAQIASLMTVIGQSSSNSESILNDLTDDNIPNDLTINSTKGLSATTGGFSSTLTVSGQSLLTANVGISTTTPGAALGVKGSGLFGGSLVTSFIRATSTTATSTFDGGVRLARSAGNVGIGTSSPGSHMLAVAGDILIGGTSTSTFQGNVEVDGILKIGQGTSYLTANDLTASNGFSINSDVANKDIVLNSSGSVGFNTSTPWAFLSIDHDWADIDKPVLVVADQGTSTPSLLIDWRGRVGIGTSTPGTRFAVKGLADIGSLFVEGAAKISNLISTSTTASGFGTTSPWASLSVEHTSANNLRTPVFVVSDQGTSTPSFLVNYSGNVGIGVRNPQESLTVNGAITASSTIYSYQGFKKETVAKKMVTVDSTGTVGQYTSLAIAPDGLPVISYLDATNNSLKVTKCGNASCSSGNTITTVVSGNVAGNNSIAIAPDGLPVIAYGGSQTLKIAKCGNASCSSGNTLSTADSTANVGENNSISIAIAQDGFPFIAYDDSSGVNGNLKVVKCGNASCSTGNTLTVIDSTADDVGYWTSVAIGTDGFPVISYKDDTNNALKVIKCGNLACSSGNTTTTVDADAADTETSIAVAPDGLPVIAYYDDNGNDLKVTKCGNAACSSGNTTTIVRNKTTGVKMFPSIAIAPDGLPIIAYYNDDDSSLEVAKCGNAFCSAGNIITNVGDGATIGEYPSIAIAPDGLPVISYYDGTVAANLKVVKCVDITCSDSSAEISTGGAFLGMKGGNNRSYGTVFQELAVTKIHNPTAFQNFSISQNGADRLTIGTTSNMGIGSTSPWGLLAIEQIMSGNELLPAFVVSDTGTATPSFIVMNATQRIGVATTSPRFNLGIVGTGYISGNTGFGGILDVQGAGTSTFDGGISVTGKGIASSNGLVISAGESYFTERVGIGTTSPYGALAIEQIASGDELFPAFVVGDTGTKTPSFIVMNATGRVGLGTTSPSLTFSVAGNILVGGTATNSFDNGIKLKSGCFQLPDGNCLELGGAAGVSTYLALTDTPSSFTAKAIPYTNTGATALLHSASLVFDGTNFGVGTDTPWGNVAIEQITSGNENLPAFVVGDTGTKTPSFIVMNSTGNVGIGDYAPTTPFSIRNTSQIPALTISSATSSSPFWVKRGGDGMGWADATFEVVYTMEVYNGRLYAGLGVDTAGDGEVWEWRGSNWVKVGGDGVNSSWNTNYESVLELKAYNGKLYAALGNTTGDSEVWEYNGVSWKQIGGDGVYSSWTSGAERTQTLEVFGGDLYAGLGYTSTSYGTVWRYNGSTWAQIAGAGENGSWSDKEEILQLIPHNDKLYAAVGQSLGDAEVWEYNRVSWTKIGGDALNSSWPDATYQEVDDLVSFNGKLYASLGWSTAGLAEVWEYDNDGLWTKVGGDAVNGSWDATNYENVMSLLPYNGKLYAGLGHSAGDAEVWVYNGSRWLKVGGDGLNSSWSGATHEEVFVMQVFNGKLYAGIGYNTSGDAEVWEYDADSSVIAKSGVGLTIGNILTIGNNNRVGIGVSNPDAALEVFDSFRVGGSTLIASSSRVGIGTSTPWGTLSVEQQHSDKELFPAFVVGDTGTKTPSFIVMNGTGNVGIGDYLPTTPLSIRSISQNPSLTISSATGSPAWIKRGGDGMGWADATFTKVFSTAVYNGKLYAGLGDDTAGFAEVWEYNNAIWKKVGGDAINNSWADSAYERVYSLVASNGKLYAGLGYDNGEAEVWEFDGSYWTKIGGDTVNSSWDASSYGFITMGIHNGKLYAGLGSAAGQAELWEYSGSAWTKIGGDAVNSSWADATYERIWTMISWRGKLYVGLGDTAGEGEVWEYAGALWTKVGGDTVNSSWDSTSYEYASALAVYNDKLYAGLGVSSTESEVWEYNGSAWTQVGGDQLNSSWDSTNYTYVVQMTAFNGRLYAALGSGVGDAEVWEYNGSRWQLIGGDAVNSSWADATYERVYMMAAYNNKLFVGLGDGAGEAEVWEYDPNAIIIAKNGAGLTIGSSLSIGRNNFVGINTNDPLAALDINGNLRVNGSTLVASSSLVGIGTSTPWGTLAIEQIQSNDAKFPAFVISDQGTTTASFIVLNGTGRVGVSTSTPYGTFAIEQIASGNENLPAFVIGDTGTATPSFTILNGTGKVGVGTSSPWGQFSVEHATGYDNQLFPAFVVADRGTGTPSFIVLNKNGYVGVGTSSPWGGFSVEILASGSEDELPSFVVGDTGSSTPALAVYSSGVTQIDQLQTGALSFDKNAGAVSWIDMPVTSSAIWGTVESYSAQIDATSTLTVYSQSDGKGGVFRSRIGIATTSPGATFAISHSTTSQYAMFIDGDSSRNFVIDGNMFVGIGTNTPRGVLAIDSNATIPALLIKAGGSGNGNIAIAVDADDTCKDSGNTATCVLNDLAELFPTSEILEAGDVAMLDSSNPGKIKKATAEGRNKLTGIISTSPAIVFEGSGLKAMGGIYNPEDNKAPVSLAGRVPVKINNEGGDIQVGDPITISSVAGVGKKATTAGLIVGYSMEDWTPATEKTQIIVVAETSYWMPMALETDNESLTADSSGLLAQVIDIVADWLRNTVVQIKKLIVGSPEAPTGITMYDLETRQPYCFVIRNGQPDYIPGECTFDVPVSGTSNSGTPDVPTIENPPTESDPIQDGTDIGSPNSEESTGAIPTSEEPNNESGSAEGGQTSDVQNIETSPTEEAAQ